jgi:hypothetical protein
MRKNLAIMPFRMLVTGYPAGLRDSYNRLTCVQYERRTFL